MKTPALWGVIFDLTTTILVPSGGNILDRGLKGRVMRKMPRGGTPPLPCHARTITIKSDVWKKEKTSSPRKVEELLFTIIWYTWTMGRRVMFWPSSEHYSTVFVLRMAHRKWRATKQQPSMLPGPAVPGSCLVSFHILWAILSTSTV